MFISSAKGRYFPSFNFGKIFLELVWERYFLSSTRKVSLELVDSWDLLRKRNINGGSLLEDLKKTEALKKPTLDELYKRFRDLDYTQVDERLAV